MFIFSRKQMNAGIALVAIAAVAGYFLLKLRPVIEPPLLVVSFPDRDIVLSASTTILEGSVGSHTDLTINGRRVRSDENGKFKTEWDLVPGLNRIDFYATNKFGKSAEVQRFILIR